MDREIDPSLIRQRTIRRVAFTVAAALLTWFAVATGFGLLRPGVSAREIRTARVARGPVAEVIDASGTVVPASENVLSSPVEARVVEILARPGTVLAAGDPILRLDTSATRLEVDRLADRASQKESERTQLRLSLESDLLDLETLAAQQKLDAEVLEHRLEQNQTLAREGLISDQQLRQVEAEAKKATLSHAQSLRQIESSRKTGASRVEAIELDLRILRNELDQARRELELATARAERAGVLTWVIDDAGVTLQRGQVFARIADQTSYRVEATTSDVHSSRLVAGMPCEIRVAGDVLRGAVASVNPAIDNGALRFEVRLDEPAHSKLRNSMRVEVSVIGGKRANVLKIERGPFATGARREQVFVVGGDEATRRDVELGAFGREEIEIVSGLAEGDEVIVSNTSEIRHAGSIRIKGR
ncbi:MAG: efflux RND transporter periplasmic adaptor subunit [Thermoanaerobaculia bacterium]